MATERRPLPHPSRARIVIDSRDASRDKFVNLRLAQELFARGELVEIDMGPDYPNSYAPRATLYNFGIMTKARNNAARA